MDKQRCSQLVMFCHDLRSLTPIDLAAGLTLRSCETGDEGGWEHIIDRVFRYDSSFAGEMQADDAFRPERVFFICRGEAPIATASAWSREQWPGQVGYLHMVAVLPEYQGKGLGQQVSLAALYQMRREGRTAAVLHTDDSRLAAIRTYLKLAFLPYLTHTDHAFRWQSVLHRLAAHDPSRSLPGFEC